MVLMNTCEGVKRGLTGIFVLGAIILFADCQADVYADQPLNCLISMLDSVVLMCWS